MRDMTKVEQAAFDAKVKQYRNVRIWGHSVLIFMLLVSLAANALSALQYGNDPVGIGLASLPPMSLFASSAMLERIRETRWYWVTLMALAALASLAFSWVHITQLAMIHHQPFLISVILPIAVDVPMILAGKMIMDHKAPQSPQTRVSGAKRTNNTIAQTAKTRTSQTTHANRTNGVKPKITAKHLATVES